METFDTDAVIPGEPRPPFTDRLKPRLGARTQLLLAGFVWYAVAISLGLRGAGWVIGSEWSTLLVVVGLVLGALKGRFIMQRVASSAIDRIQERGRDKCAGGFFSWKSWLVVLVMMAGGHALRLTAIPRPILGALYIAIAMGLLIAGRLYWRAAIEPVDLPDT